MPIMKNKDIMRQENFKIVQKLSEAMQAGDADAAAQAIQELHDSVATRIEQEFEQYGNVTDMMVLQSRGLRALTSEENAWYQKFIAAAKSGAKQEITNLTDHMVPTIFDRVIEDMRKAHPLLGAIEIRNAVGAVRMVMNAKQMRSLLGSWGPITSAITEQVQGAIRFIDIDHNKYTAFFLIPKDFVKFNFGFAPMWVDAYIRNILSETVAFGLEKAIVTGDGDGRPTGLAFDVSTQSNGKYSEKTAVAINTWDDYRDTIADNLLLDANGDYRVISEVLMVVNPVDYVKKIRPAMQVITTAGIQNMINRAFPTNVVQSPFVTAGTAKVGIAENYFAAINGGQSGIIEYSDEYQFLEDNRVYTTRVYGNARPVDNVSFLNLDISGIETYATPVKVVGSGNAEGSGDTEGTSEP